MYIRYLNSFTHRHTSVCWSHAAVWQNWVLNRQSLRLVTKPTIYKMMTYTYPKSWQIRTPQTKKSRSTKAGICMTLSLLYQGSANSAGWEILWSRLRKILRDWNICKSVLQFLCQSGVCCFHLLLKAILHCFLSSLHKFPLKDRLTGRIKSDTSLKKKHGSQNIPPL